MRQYLAEGLTGAFPFIVDRSKLTVTESQPNGQTYRRIPGRFSVCDCVNGNNRRYSKRVWEKNLQPGSTLQESIKRNAAFGLLEHPKDGLITLQSPISHQVIKAEMFETKDASGKPVCEVTGEIALYNTEEGSKLAALIEGGYNPMVSSRGYGSLTKGADGVDNVEEDYVCESWDVVIKPSFDNAELTPSRPPLSTTTPQMAAPFRPNPTAESSTLDLTHRAYSAADAGYHKPVSAEAAAGIDRASANVCPKCGNPLELYPDGYAHCSAYGKGCDYREGARAATPSSPQLPGGTMFGLKVTSKEKQPPDENNLKESTPSAASSPASVSQQQTHNNRMEINEIKTRVTALRSLEPTKLTRFAESMSQIEGLHQEVAEWAAADPKRSWEAQKLHKELDSVAEGFTAVAKQPIRQAKHLTEQNAKLMKVVNAVTSTAVAYKKRLGEALKVSGRSKAMMEELTRRGQGWQRLAESRKVKFLTLEKDFDTSCEALDLMAKRFHEDTTELARRVIVLEFKEKAQTPEIQKRLKEATRLRHIAAIRTTLEEADALKQPKEGETPGKEGIKGDKQKGAGSPEEGKVAAEPGKVKNESQPARMMNSSRDVREINESVDLVKRLSGAAK